MSSNMPVHIVNLQKGRSNIQYFPKSLFLRNAILEIPSSCTRMSLLESSVEDFPQGAVKSASESKGLLEAGKDWWLCLRKVKTLQDQKDFTNLLSSLPTRCALFLVLKGELELARNDIDLCQSDLRQVLFLLESCTGESTHAPVSMGSGESDTYTV